MLSLKKRAARKTQNPRDREREREIERANVWDKSVKIISRGNLVLFLIFFLIALKTCAKINMQKPKSWTISSLVCSKN